MTTTTTTTITLTPTQCEVLLDRLGLPDCLRDVHDAEEGQTPLRHEYEIDHLCEEMAAEVVRGWLDLGDPDSLRRWIACDIVSSSTYYAGTAPYLTRQGAAGLARSLENLAKKYERAGEPHVEVRLY